MYGFCVNSTGRKLEGLIVGIHEGKPLPRQFVHKFEQSHALGAVGDIKRNLHDAWVPVTKQDGAAGIGHLHQIEAVQRVARREDVD